MNMTELMALWDTGEDKPYKGSLIDWDEWQKSNKFCSMCAQGQVLHAVGGWTPDRLNNVGQTIADIETAKLLNISRAHAVLLRTVNDRFDGAPSIVLTDPGEVLGGEWYKVLDFWNYLDGLNDKQWAAARDAARDAAWDANPWVGAVSFTVQHGNIDGGET